MTSRTAWRIVAVCALGIAALAAASSARQGAVAPPNKPAAAPGAPKQAKPWHITFDELVHSDATGEGEASRVVATSDEDTVIRADTFIWNDKKRTARAAGNLHFADDQAEGTAERVDIEYMKSKRLMVLTGNVRLTLKARKPEPPKPGQASTATQPAGGAERPKSDEGALRDYPIEVTCDRAEYEYAKDKRHAILTGNLRAVQKLKDYTRTLTAPKAEWFGKDERVVLTGPAKVEDTKGRKGETPEDVTIHTREGHEGIKLRKGVYTMPADEDDQPASKPPERQSPPPDTGARPPAR